MRRYGYAIFLAAGLLALGGLAAAMAQERATTDAEREAFIKNFKRIGVNTPPTDALFLRILVEASRAQRGIEVGSANGYGAINMGVGFERVGGRLWTIDIDPQMVKECRENVARMGLEKTVTVLEGDALKVLPTLEGEYDFMFLDAVKRDCLKYVQAVKLKPGAVVVAHNAIRAAGEMKEFLDFMAASPDWEMVIVRPTDRGDGMAVCYKIR